MEEKELKTSVGQRVAIIAVAVIMLGSIIAGYAAIVINGSKSNTSKDGSISDAKLAQYEAEYAELKSKFDAATGEDFEKFVGYKDQVKKYDEEAANSNGVAVKDLAKGEGRELTEGDYDYLAYYLGWCADGTVFDSSLDDVTEPTGFTGAINASGGLITGWNEGVVGMKLGGVRLVTIPGEKAYGDLQEICGGYNKPLKFIVMAVENDASLNNLSTEYMQAYYKVLYGRQGIDYEAL